MHVGHTEATQLKYVNNNNHEKKMSTQSFQPHTIHNMFRTCIAAYLSLYQFVIM